MNSQIPSSVMAIVRAVANNLTMDELIATYMAAMQGFDPTPVEGYEKAKSLFTEANKTRMHRDTLSALDIIIGERMSQEK